MRNYEEKFEKMDSEYDNLYNTFFEFKKNPSYGGKQKVLKALRDFNEYKNQFSATIRNFFINR